MAKDIWQSKENSNEYFGHHEDLVSFNQAKGGTMLVENDTAYDIFSKGEALALPSTIPQKKKVEKKKVLKKVKIINVANVFKNGKNINFQIQETSGKETPMPAPPVVMAENLGDESSSMVRTGDQDPLEKMRKCGEQEEETGMPMPKVVDEEGK